MAACDDSCVLPCHACAVLSMRTLMPHHTPSRRQPPEAETRGAMQLLDSLDARDSGHRPGITAMPHGFLEEFAARHEADGLDLVGSLHAIYACPRICCTENLFTRHVAPLLLPCFPFPTQRAAAAPQIIAPVVKELARRTRAASPLGNYSAPLSAIASLCRCEPLARTLVRLREWLPNLKDVSGRGIELPGSSWLGPCFSVSSIPDDINNSQVRSARPSLQPPTFSPTTPCPRSLCSPAWCRRASRISTSGGRVTCRSRWRPCAWHASRWSLLSVGKLIICLADYTRE